jgi:tetratricopeptide (TPR) repeat protein
MKTLLKSLPRAAAPALLLLAAASVASARQQPPPPKVRLPQASPQATLAETIGVTDITINYHRPSVRGRMLWGDVAPERAAAIVKANSFLPQSAPEGTLDGAQGAGKEFPLVPNGHVWRAGANEATKLTVTDDVLVNGQPLKAGSYSLHMIPGRDEWTIIFNKAADQWGSYSYDPKQDALRVRAKPEWRAESQELLGYEVPQASANSARVVLRWEKIAVPFTIEVPNQEALVRSKIDALVAAAPEDWRVPAEVANAYYNDDKFDEALAWADRSIKVKETFQNLRLKAALLLSMKRRDEAIAVGERAIARGKADGEDTTRFEKRLADIKSGKM